MSTTVKVKTTTAERLFQRRLLQVLLASKQNACLEVIPSRVFAALRGCSSTPDQTEHFGARAWFRSSV